jgi:hypothetical protein
MKILSPSEARELARNSDYKNQVALVELGDLKKAIEREASKGNYSVLIYTPCKANIVFLKSLGYKVRPAFLFYFLAGGCVISWR